MGSLSKAWRKAKLSICRMVRESFGEQHHRRASEAELIASHIDYDSALRIMTDVRDRLSLRAAWNARSVSEQIAAAIKIRGVLSEQMDFAELTRYIQHLQARYKSAAGDAAYAKYDKDCPKNLAQDHGAARAELRTLLYRLLLAYSVSHYRDRYLRSLKRECFVALFVGMAILLCSVVIQTSSREYDPIWNYVVVALLGLGGSITSILRRSQSIVSADPLDEDPVVQVSALQEGRGSLYVAALTGPIFALILLLVFIAGGLTIADLTPNFCSVGDLSQGISATKLKLLAACPKGTVGAFRLLDRFASPQSTIDVAKLAFWAFAAGFAEKFVPDVIDRVTRKAEK